jgi:hypothetical protein
LSAALKHGEHRSLSATPKIVRSPRYQALVKSLPGVRLRQAHADESVSELIGPPVFAVEGTAAKLSRSSSPSEFHRLRVKLKRLSRAKDMLDPANSKQVKRTAQKLKGAQEILSIQHYLVTAIGWLREIADAAAVSGPTLLAAGAVYQSAQCQTFPPGLEEVKDDRTHTILREAVRELDAEGRRANVNYKVVVA